MSELSLMDFMAEEWQQRIREAEADIEAGRVYRVKSQEIDKVLDWLDEQNRPQIKDKPSL